MAREVAQARFIAGARYCHKFHEENDWIYDRFPNMDRKAEGREARNGVLERRGFLRLASNTVEWLLGGWIGNKLEGALKGVLRKRLKVHYGKHGQSVR